MERVTAAEQDPTEAVPGVEIAILAGGERANLQHFAFDPGTSVPAHSHHHEQEGYLVEGTLTFLLDDEELAIEAGDSYSIPSGERHAAENRGETDAWGIEVFSPPRESPDWAE